MKKTTSGFTIVELLIVIVVIAILAAITVVAYNGIQQKARDSNRSNDITQFKKAVELYKVDNGFYPACGSDNGGCAASNLVSILSSYGNATFLDPQNPAKTYSYVRGTVAQDSYGFLVNYEAKPQCKTGVNINVGWWGSAVPTC